MAKNMKYKQHENVRKGMAKDGIPNSSKVASILFKVFLELDGKLRVEICREKKLCTKPGDFYEWRSNLKKKGWLEYETDQQGRLRYYQPGRKLLGYINKEKALSFEIASKDEIRFSEMRTNKMIKSVEKDARNQMEQKYSILENKHDKLEKEVNALKTAVDRVLNIIDPEADEKKRANFMNGGYDPAFKTIDPESLC